VIVADEAALINDIGYVLHLLELRVGRREKVPVGRAHTVKRSCAG
jgi:hypothetical protein